MPRISCVITIIIAMLTTVIVPLPVAAEPLDERAATRLVIPPELLDESRLTTAAAARQSRDSVANGALIGAVIGGVALGLFGGIVCTALREEGNPPCWRGVLVIGAIGAGIGAAAGAGIDALRSPTQPAVRVRLRF
jgi:NhaP-type Na+/H+ or K+/H+ antiporter